MPYSSSVPFYGNTPSPSSTALAGTSTQRLALDNLIRRELKVSDPSDPAQIAQALLSRYQQDPRALAISQEASGLPFLLSAPAQASPPQTATSSDAELQQAVADVERDLQELTTNAVLKDIKPELQGWATAVRSLIGEGSAAARFALDPRQRDKVFGIRRTLGDYARMSRLVGTLTPVLNINYRKFAQSLDEMAAVMLVMMGEAIANVGFNGGRYLLQAPYSELQVRRDAVIYALRNLVGATQEAYSPNDWPRGVDAYRSLFKALEVQGQGDLRALLVENELVRIMDMLLQRAGQGGAEGLRQLGATAQLDVERLRRLVIIGQRAVSPESPPLTAFLEALQLFIDAFDTSGGFRLLRIARPPILFYGLYGTSGLDPSDQRLLQLVIQRGLLADQLDCFMQCCGNDPNYAKCQIVLDKILYDTDRAIDLYAVGLSDFGEPERRAAAYSYIIESFIIITTPPSLTTSCNIPSVIKNILSIVPTNFGSIPNLLRPPLDISSPVIAGLINNLNSFASIVSNNLQTTFVGGNNLCGSGDPTTGTLCNRLSKGVDTAPPFTVSSLTKFYQQVQQGQALLIQNHINLTSPPSLDAFFAILQQELCIQRDMEDRWKTLVQTLAPDCVPYSDVFDFTANVIEGASQLVSDQICPTFNIAIPPQFETSLDSIVDDIDRTGVGRPTGLPSPSR